MKTILVDAVNCFVIKDEGLNKEMQVLLDSYPNKKIILTNANAEEREKFGLDKVPYDLFTLEHNPNKPDSEYYKIFLDKFNLSVEDVIYFEHHEGAVEAAKSVGINTFHYDKDSKDLVALKKFLDGNL